MLSHEDQISNCLDNYSRLIALLQFWKPDASINTIITIAAPGYRRRTYDNYDINNNNFLALQNSGNMNLIKKSVYEEVLEP
jgi:hypothetical protein